MADHPTPAAIMQLGTGFFASRTLLSAVELGLFTELAKGPLTVEELQGKLGLHPRSARDFFDALVALGMLQRQGDGYRNTPETDMFLDRAKPSYIGGVLEMAAGRLYRFWDGLTDALKTGQPQNEIKTGGDVFGALYSDPQRRRSFIQAMTGLSMGAAIAIAQKFPWQQYKTFADIGAAQGGVAVQIALAHPHLTGVAYDLPVVKDLFNEHVSAFGLQDRVRFQAGDFFKEPLPRTDVLLMGHILHDWGLNDKRLLIKKAYDALPSGGALIVFEALIDDERQRNAFGLLMSLNMLIETEAGFDYTGQDCCQWLREAGFKETRVEHLAGPDSMVIGIK